MTFALKYHHTQKAPLFLILVVVGLAMLIAAVMTPDLPVRLILLGSGGMMFLFAMTFRQLTVSDQGDHLLIAFGPLPMFRRRIRYSDITEARQAQTTVLDGWGIHISPSGGWTWNLWGFDCVDVYLKGGRKIRVGTNDRAALESFLTQQIANRP